MKLPSKPAERPVTPPERTRALIAGPPKGGKSTFAASFCPKTTLIVDTQHGTDRIPGEHFIQHVTGWTEFVQVVDAIVKDPGHYNRLVLDLISDLWRWCDVAHAGKTGVSAASSNDYQNSLRAAETVFTQTIGRLVATDLGLWIIAHSTEKQDGDVSRHRVSIANKNVDEYLRGVVDYVWLLERRGPTPVLVTEPSGRFEAGGRTAVTSGKEPDARRLWRELDMGLNPSKYENSDENSDDVEAVAA